MTDWLRLLHNSGAFDYSRAILACYVIESLMIAFGSTVLICYAINRLVSLAKGKETSGGRLSLIFAGILTALCIWASPAVIAKMLFAKGLESYSRDRLQDAQEYYLLARRLDPRFQLISEALLQIAIELNQEFPPPNLHDHIIDSAEVPLLARMAQHAGRGGQHQEAAYLYGRAYSRSKNGNFLVRRIAELVAAERWKQAARDLSALFESHALSNAEPEVEYLQAAVEFHEDQPSKAVAHLRNAIALAPHRAEFYLLYGRALFKTGETKAAVEALRRGVELRPDLAEAHYELGRYYVAVGKCTDGSEALCRSIYYDNKLSSAAVLLECMKAGKNPVERAIQNDNQYKISQIPEHSIIGNVGESARLRLEASGFDPGAELAALALEPYGFGVQAEITSQKPEVRDGKLNLVCEVLIRYRRPNTVNLGKPWDLNIVVADLVSATFTSRIIKISVLDDGNTEGRVLLVVTEDLEQTAGLGSLDGSRRRPHITPREAEIDLIQKPKLAGAIAQSTGVKWSHIVDIGSALLRLKLAETSTFGSDWNGLWTAMKVSLRKTLDSGHDIQLHIHGYNIPGNRFCRQYFDPVSGAILFQGNETRVQGSSGVHNAWANNFRKFGNWSEESTRVGSIFAGIKLLESEIHENAPQYRTIFFRAGEYDFGEDENSVAASIQALRMNQILAGSDAHQGSPFGRDFKFYKRVGQNVYFSARDSVSDRAASLHDIGILQLLPVPQRLMHDHLSPTSSIKDVVENYQLCLSERGTKPGIYVIVEMYHLNTANIYGDWDNLQQDYGDWKRIKDQFSQLKKYCPKLELVTVSKAIEIYLDSYAPDLVALRTNERRMSGKAYDYDIQFLGRDIDVSKSRPHFTSVKPPSYFVGRIDWLEIRKGNEVIRRWQGVGDYNDLEFRATSRTGYTMRVLLRD